MIIHNYLLILLDYTAKNPLLKKNVIIIKYIHLLKKKSSQNFLFLTL